MAILKPLTDYFKAMSGTTTSGSASSYSNSITGTSTTTISPEVFANQITHSGGTFTIDNATIRTEPHYERRLDAMLRARTIHDEVAATIMHRTQEELLSRGIHILMPLRHVFTYDQMQCRWLFRVTTMAREPLTISVAVDDDMLEDTKTSDFVTKLNNVVNQVCASMVLQIEKWGTTNANP